MPAHRARSSFDIDIEDLVIAALDLQYQHFAGLPGGEVRQLADDNELIERYLGCARYPIEQDAANVEWSIERNVLNTFLKCPTAQQLGIKALK